ncbi:MAG: hypothetical protein K2I68_04385, partial [Bacteroidales bacterium]|nr:hypothetical protein [Bacteroidales bacterium]
LSRLIAAVPYTARKKPKQPKEAANATVPDVATATDNETKGNWTDGLPMEETAATEAAEAVLHTPIQSYIPAELRQSDDIVLEVHRRPDEAPALCVTAPATPATIGAAMAAAATTPATVTTAGLGGASTIAIDDIPLASQTISGTLSESLRETAAPAPMETPASASTPTPTPTAIRLEDIPLEEPAPAKAAPQPEAAPETPDIEIGFTVERPAEPETADAAAITPPANHIGLDTPYDPTLELRDYRFPTLDLLEDFGAQETQVQEEELLSNKNRIVETLQNYGIKIDTIKATIGPTVTLYEIVPAAGIRISKIKNLEDDIALSLSALGIRIIAPIPGKGTIGIEVPNQNKQIVPMRDMICCQKFQNDDYSLPIALGKTISNEAFVTDLAKMPHLLVAGATGQGKSVGLNAIIASLLYKKHPSELKFVMVDPKKVELSLFNKIERHYLAKLPDAEEAIITDTRKVVRTLKSLCIEMDTR